MHNNSLFTDNIPNIGIPKMGYLTMLSLHVHYHRSQFLLVLQSRLSLTTTVFGMRDFAHTYLKRREFKRYYGSKGNINPSI